jgi:selenocysteine-specific elongation factor
MHVIATAGHVDHGKSTLIRGLTGMEPDRWAEERQRGMTIDLGYAWTVLDGGNQIAFVDVPGHQRFITNMLAGIGPIPAVLLVVAADEGWCRQTAEHLSALDALDVRHGILAVTRSDLGDAELAIEEAREYLAGTSLEGIESVAVSPVTGFGMSDLRGALSRMTGTLPALNSTDVRLWVDRVFTIRGSGTVVTGTLGSGAIAVGDELTICSTGEPVHIRGLECLKQQARSATAVARVAVNLRGVKRSDIQRGDALVTPGRWVEATSMDVRLVKLSGTPPVQLIMHVGSAAVPVRMRRFAADTARLSWKVPIPLHIGERLILRDPGPQHVVAGALVLDLFPPVLRRRGFARARAEQLAVMDGQPSPAEEVARRGVVRSSALRAAGVLVDGAAVPAGAVLIGDWLVDSSRWTAWQEELRLAVSAWMAKDPLTAGMPRAAVVDALRLPDSAVLEALVDRTADLRSDSDGVHATGASAQLPDHVRAALDVLRKRLVEDPLDAADAQQLEEAGLTKRHLAIATKTGQLLRLAPDIYLLPDVVSRVLERLAELPEPFTLSQARKALATTRRVAVPLLEFLDKQGVTRRVDSQLRVLRH